MLRDHSLTQHTECFICADDPRRTDTDTYGSCEMREAPQERTEQDVKKLAKRGDDARAAGIPERSQRDPGEIMTFPYQCPNDLCTCSVFRVDLYGHK